MSQVIRIPRIGDVVAERYRLIEEIGRGGFGVVFRATQLNIQREVALKMLLPHALTVEGVVARFEREARLAAGLRHPNSVVIYDHGLHSGAPDATPLPYIAMELLEGETLQSYLVRHRRLGAEEVTDILLEALGSLGEAH